MYVTVEYCNPPTGDLPDMARVIEQAIDSDPDRIILIVADFDALSGSVAIAVDQGIPVIAIIAIELAGLDRLNRLYRLYRLGP